jgi:subtilase family serine protease
MRLRTPLLALGSAATIAALTWAATLTATAAEQPVSPAVTATPFVTTDACAAAAPPVATCFAKRVVSGGPVATLAAPAGLAPADLVSAYAVPSGGTGQVIGIVDAFSNPNLEADLAVYRSTYGLPACTVASGCLRIVNQAGATSPLPTADSGWGLETSLDVDMASAICPACKILVVQGTSADLGDLGASVDMAVQLGADVVSNSYGTGVEFAAETDLESHYIHPGHPIVVSAGDIGYSVSFPAASSHVTSVGGTTLTKSGTAWSETVWSGTGGGCSAYMAKPSWQTDANCPMRMLNDVAAVADPATGVAVYDTYQLLGWQVVGGTSASAPIIAAMYALTGTAADRVNDGSVPWLRHSAAAFRDVTSGTNVPGPNAATCGGDYLCTGVVGYDGPTGWGTPTGLTGLTPS